MNDCPNGGVRDLLPAYVHGTLSGAERSAVARHLAACGDCAAEVELITAASRAFPAPEIDLARIVAALPAGPRRGTQSTFTSRALRIAAAFAIVAIGAYSVVVIQESRRTDVSSVPAAKPGASAATAVVAAAPPKVAAAAAAVDSPPPEVRTPAVAARSRPAMSFGGGLSDLSEEQLDTLLGELDGFDALPSVEPETHLTPILPPADGGHGVP